MKLFLIAILALAGANLSHSDESQPKEEVWACVAYGYDQNNLYRSIPGDFMQTEEDAKHSALNACIFSGLNACQVGSCYQY